ncbi:MAG: chemotaxis protein CheW [bacterium]|nr:chemotaxis protein CheW [bacterium]
MDLVEIRKKAKSRKPKSAKAKADKEKVAAKPVNKEPAARQIQELLPEEAVVAEKAEQLEPAVSSEESAEKESEDMDENKVIASARDEDSLSSLKEVLMSQHVEKKEEEEEQLQLLTFMLGGEEYALNIMDIKEIIRPRECTEVPRAPEYILGIISLRGTIIPIFDVNKRLGLPVGLRGAQNRIVVVRSREHLFGLHVDSVVQVMDIPLSSIEPPPEILGGVEGDYLRGVGKIDDRLIILLNLGRILAMEEEQGSARQALSPGRKG